MGLSDIRKGQGQKAVEMREVDIFFSFLQVFSHFLHWFFKEDELFF